jgi:predicted NBD/HSP70 family sugar kinase
MSVTNRNERLNVSMVKDQSRKLVFQHITRHGPVTRSDISLSTGLSHGTVKTLMDEFLAAGLVEERKDNSPAVGRKPGKVYLKPGARRIGVLELAPDRLTYSDLNLALEPISPPIITTRPSGAEYRSWLEGFLTRLPVGTSDLELGALAGIGVVAPGPYRRETDSVISNLIPDLRQIPLEKTVRGLNDIPVIVGEDVHLAALAEAELLEGDVQPLFYLYLSRGVGGAYLSDNRILAGSGGLAGEIGQMIMDDGNRLEASVGWLPTREAFGIPPVMGDIEAQDFIIRSLAEKPQAQLALTTIIHRLAKALSHAICVLNPKTIIIGGVFDFLGRDFSVPLELELRRLLIDAHKNDLTVSISSSGKRGMILGAGMLIIDRWLGTEFS